MELPAEQGVRIGLSAVVIALFRRKPHAYSVCQASGAGTRPTASASTR